MPHEIRGVDVEKYAWLCQQTSPKRWFGNIEMTSNCDVTNSEHQIQMTTIRPWTKPPPMNFLRTPLHTSEISWFAATETGSIMSRTRVSRMKQTATQGTPFTWPLNHLFIHTFLCDSGRRTRRGMVHVAISRIAERCFRAITVNITLRVEGGRRHLSRWLSHRQSLALVCGSQLIRKLAPKLSLLSREVSDVWTPTINH